MLDEEKGQFLR